MFVIATHDVDDAAHWQGSPERDKFAEPAAAEAQAADGVHADTIQLYTVG